MHEALRIYLRFALAVFLLSYGLFKILLNQADFPPNPSRMLLPWGMFPVQMIPIQMMGVSPVYQIFAGGVEFVAGLLLVFRRTARVGAFVAMAAATNVAALNLGYHMWGMSVLSIAMLVMASILVAPDLPRLANVLVLERAVSAPRVPAPYSDGRFRRAAQVCGFIFLAGESSYLLHRELTTGMHWRGRPPLYGAYDVETFARGRDTIPPLLTDSTRWLQFAVDPSADPLMRTGNAYASIIVPGGTQQIALRIDTASKTIRVIPFNRREQPSEWKYSVPDKEHLVLAIGKPTRTNGAADGSTASEMETAKSSDSLRITLRRIDLASMPLLQSRRASR
jgi:hypothetical protein